jgi:hypothetical protein
MASVVPHACFAATLSRDREDYLPPGLALAESLRDDLKAAGIDVTPPDCWRDCGWSLRAALGLTFEIYFAPWIGRHWLLAIAPLDRPGLLGRLLGRSPPEDATGARRLAQVVHARLVAHERIGRVFWQDGGPPHPRKGVPSPELLPWDQGR